MDDKPSQALRAGGGKSSMWLAHRGGAATGEADAAVSAGNTGALMAMAKFCLKTMAHIERPAIAAMWPTLRGESIVLDVGANDRRGRQPSRRHRDHGRGHGPHRLRHRAADRRAAQCRHRGDQGHRGGQGGRPAAARGRTCRTRLSRLRRGRRHRQGHRRRGRDRGLRRQHRAEDRRGHGQADRRVSARAP